jgi:hypothetical protein
MVTQVALWSGSVAVFAATVTAINLAIMTWISTNKGQPNDNLENIKVCYKQNMLLVLVGKGIAGIS